MIDTFFSFMPLILVTLFAAFVGIVVIDDVRRHARKRYHKKS